MDAGSIPYWWTRDALLAVSKSTQPIPEKRLRTAWLFKNHEQLARALTEGIVNSLRAWLLNEDWWSVEKVWPGVGPNSKRREPEKVMHDCAYYHAKGLMCGETWRSDRGGSGP